MTRNLWTRVLWGGVIGITVEDLILIIGRGAGWVKLNVLAIMARVLTSPGVSVTTSGMILGFVIHLIEGAILALIFAAIVRALHSRHNIIGGLIYGLVLWIIMGAVFRTPSISAALWSFGTPTTVTTLIGALAYGLILGYAASEEAVRESV